MERNPFGRDISVQDKLHEMFKDSNIIKNHHHNKRLVKYLKKANPFFNEGELLYQGSKDGLKA